MDQDFYITLSSNCVNEESEVNKTSKFKVKLAKKYYWTIIIG